MFEFLKQRLEMPKWTKIKEANEALNDEDSTQGLLGIDSSASKFALKNHKKTVLYILFGLNIAWSLVNITVIWLQHPLELNHSFRRVSAPSPIFDAVDLGPKAQKMDGTIHENSIIYRKAPSPEVDKAWAILSMDNYEFINVTRADIIAAGADPNTAERWDPNDDVYIAEVEVGHKIHCLNEVRKSIWGDHYFGNDSIRADDEAIAKGEYDESDEGMFDEKTTIPTIKGRRRMRRMHTMHCIHILLQDLMCNADVGIITVNWVHAHLGAPGTLVEDFSTQKQCRNFDALLDWVHKNAVKDGDKIYQSLTSHPSTRFVETEDSYWPGKMGHHHAPN